MGRHGNNFKNITQIIFRSPTQVFVYDLKNGKHVTNMKRATRTIYKKKANQDSNESKDSIIIQNETISSNINIHEEQHYLNLALEAPATTVQNFNEENNNELENFESNQTDMFDIFDHFFT